MRQMADPLTRSGCDWHHVHPSPGAIKAHLTVLQGEDRVIATQAHILARQKLRSALPDNDVAGHVGLAPKFFHTKSLADAIATVLDAALSFFVSHESGWITRTCWRRISFRRG